MGRSLTGNQLRIVKYHQPSLWGGWTREIQHTCTPFSKSFLSDAPLTLTPFCSTSARKRQTSSSSSYNLFPKGFILTLSQVSIEMAIFAFSSLPIFLSCVCIYTHACVLWIFYVCGLEVEEWKKNKTYCSIFQFIATRKPFTVHPLPCNFYRLTAEKKELP